MKLPSLKHVLQESSRTFQRFPFVLLSAALGTIVAILLMKNGTLREEGVLHNLLFTSALGLPFFTALAVVGEKRKWRTVASILMQIAGAALLASYYFSLPQDAWSHPSRHAIRFVLLNICLHALVAFAPFLGRNELNGFWQFNKTLFLRFLTAALYSSVLFLGLALALLAIENLFEVNIKGERYGQLWALISGLFNTWFFLAGVPEDIEALEQERHYPKGLKVFTQYILIPLVVIYLLILYAYEAKIILAWSWPKGWVANLVLGFAVSGILSLLLVYPIQFQEENRWIKIFSQWYYVALIPLLAMLLLAIGRRISDYGVTENRYFVLVMGLALAGIVLYFIFSRSKNIKVIPITLCALAFFAAFGPWGAFQISGRSQVERLSRLLSKSEILVQGKVQKTPHAVAFKDRQEISSIVAYLYRVHDYAAIQPWFDQDLSQLPSQLQDSLRLKYLPDSPARVLDLMGITFVNTWDKDSSATNHFNFTSSRENGLDIGGYDCLLSNRDFSPANAQHEAACGSTRYVLRLEDSALLLFPASQPADSVRIALEPLLQNVVQEYGHWNNVIPVEKMTATASAQSLRAKFFFWTMNGERNAGVMKVNYFQVDVLIKRNLESK
ncbi:MAG: DUF4153 domain-containing protein [bacterium]